MCIASRCMRALPKRSISQHIRAHPLTRSSPEDGEHLWVRGRCAQLSHANYEVRFPARWRSNGRVNRKLERRIVIGLECGVFVATRAALGMHEHFLSGHATASVMRIPLLREFRATGAHAFRE